MICSVCMIIWTEPFYRLPVPLGSKCFNTGKGQLTRVWVDLKAYFTFLISWLGSCHQKACLGVNWTISDCCRSETGAWATQTDGEIQNKAWVRVTSQQKSAFLDALSFAQIVSYLGDAFI